MSEIYKEAREAHNKKLHVLAEKLYREDQLSRKVGFGGGLYWLDCMILLGMKGEAEELIERLWQKQTTDAERELLEKRLEYYEGILAEWAQQERLPSHLDIGSIAKEMPIKPFYISSYGGSATAWLSASLSSHPDIVCYHGTMSFPPGRADRRFHRIHPREFMQSLVVSAEATRFKKAFGAIHGYHGTSAREAVEDLGGTFCGVIRHPINRLKSLSHIHLAEHCEALEPVRFRKLKGDVMATLAETQNEQLLEKAANRASTIFRNLVCYDFQMHAECGRERLFKMEDLTSKRKSYKEFFNYVTDGKVSPSWRYVSSVMKINNQNRRVSNAPAAFALRSWPQEIKSQIYQNIEDLGREKYVDFYESYGYSDLII
ncbi:hypothetical protein [Roseibium marinum]|uniref:Sulfotransferase family protein n=1 Tax=Roseibium marinum TaxID=281252 RepID=A0A2S3V385_9HYPH|nr:hypothetical protein [Roseibium marinum]POF34360.1 hypothetical protein CLV41_101814 [Roseibium marinum]